jgi:hypothetical protein
MVEMSYVYAGTVRSAAGGSGGIFRQCRRQSALGSADKRPARRDAGCTPSTVHPANPEVVFIGTTKVAFRSADHGGRWERLRLPDPEADIWSITVDPTDCRTVYAGCGQSASSAARMTAITGRNCVIRGSPTGYT